MLSKSQQLKIWFVFNLQICDFFEKIYIRNKIYIFWTLSEKLWHIFETNLSTRISTYFEKIARLIIIIFLSNNFFLFNSNMKNTFLLELWGQIILNSPSYLKFNFVVWPCVVHIIWYIQNCRRTNMHKHM